MLRLAIVGLVSIGLLGGCMSPKGATVEEKRQAVQDMRAETLAELYEIHPYAKTQIAEAVGYGVFSNIGINLLLLSTASGWEASAQADAVAKSEDKGGAWAGAVDVAPGIRLYQLTKHGLALQATIQGTKFWKYDDLN